MRHQTEVVQESGMERPSPAHHSTVAQESIGDGKRAETIGSKMDSHAGREGRPHRSECVGGVGPPSSKGFLAKEM